MVSNVARKAEVPIGWHSTRPRGRDLKTSRRHYFSPVSIRAPVPGSAIDTRHRKHAAEAHPVIREFAGYKNSPCILWIRRFVRLNAGLLTSHQIIPCLPHLPPL
jgi:hypothetical protein